MYLHLSNCPLCGAPIFLPTVIGDRTIVDLSSGQWTMAPEPTYTCACHTHLFTPPKDDFDEAMRKQSVKGRRSGGYSGGTDSPSGYRPFSPGPRET